MAMTSAATRSRREGLHATTYPKMISSSTEYRRPVASAKAVQQFSLSPPRASSKRHLEISSNHCDAVLPKKARIAVEIPARSSSYHSRFPKESATDAPPQLPAKPTVAAPPPQPRSAIQTRAPPAKPAATKTTTPAASAEKQPALTKHQEKVVNGLKHELDRLQPNAADTTAKDQGRKLRSQEATRFKSELSAFFPEYDEVIGNDPKKEYLLNLETPAVITSDTAPRSIHNYNPPTFPVQSNGDNLYTDLFDCQRIDFTFLAKQSKPLDPSQPHDDPLPDSYYEPIHKKEEKQERSVRNTEKIRAQHERDQVIRLLDGLQGPDWLRVMGVSGITESRKKQFEPAREYFIKGCESILDKFRRWTAEEKRRKREKDRKAKYQAEREAMTSEEKDQESTRTSRATSTTNGHDDRPNNKKRKREAVVPDSEDEAMGDDELDHEPPDEVEESDVDASVAKQLREEALAAAAKKKSSAKSKPPPKKRSRSSKPPPTATKASTVEPSPAPPQHEKEFTSFFAKKYQRDAALSTSRRRISTRRNNVLAWGVPVPDVAETDFSLPEGLREEVGELRSAAAMTNTNNTNAATATTTAKATRGRPARGQRRR
ncbi:something about silencing, SAS, complex subunit 4-domain-containing protein [Apiosordaria backusii]|uniref:Something about silencing, SAS, complex subunit 4-domain-containing protein n=1 Tax=Apiosordaria backusii TaxID=314023 RepID=A0AA40B7M9_9PEZI|nr:something about silencing, SAS, complex subunit 4-domain-containing protein [Apiosordaria backusii]